MECSIRMKFISAIVTVLIIVCTCLGVGLRGQEIIFRDEDESRNEDPGCIAPNGHRGECVDIRTCPILLALIGQPNQHEYLKQTRCGWNQSIPMVCCDTDRNCTTSDNEPGKCVELASCPHIKGIDTNYTVSSDTKKQVENHRCGSEKFVCCTSLPSKLIDQVNVTTSTTESFIVDNCEISVPPDPLSQCCGRDGSSNRIIGGEATAIDQYPWTAAIEYARKDIVKVKCGGTLISGTYVVTAAHCLSDKTWIPLNVRLGDYDIDNSGADCVEVEGGGEDCTDEPLTISIAKIIPHPDYSMGFRGQIHDIGLIKLQDPAPYTDFIRPACLPTNDFTETTTTTIELIATGWGVSDDIRSYSPIKRHVGLPFVRRQVCSNVYMRLGIVLGEGQICAGGEKGKDSCKGDSGGALMLIKEHFTEIVGVTSFGYTPCALENKPAVYTNIHHYLPWITSTMSQN